MENFVNYKQISIYEYTDVNNLCDNLAQEFIKLSHNGISHIALSGGSTPKALFEKLRSVHNQIQWHNIHFWWVDERAVPSHSVESNYGVCKRILLDHTSIPHENVHPMNGDITPISSAKEYADVIKEKISAKDLPQFTWTILGMGTDGHTASIFPEKPLTNVVGDIVGVGVNPTTMQERVSLTKECIIHSHRVSLLITGETKQDIFKELIHTTSYNSQFPATLLHDTNGICEIHTESSVVNNSETNNNSFSIKKV